MSLTGTGRGDAHGCSRIVYSERFAVTTTGQRAETGHPGTFSPLERGDSFGPTGISNDAIGIADGKCSAACITRKCAKILQPSGTVPKECVNASACVRLTHNGRAVIYVEGGTVVASGQCSQIYQLTAGADKGAIVNAVSLAGLSDRVTG
jgi:hypothetical protein